MKKKFLALAMASAVMLTGAGYAAWTDQLNVNSTVSTGELNVQFQGPHTDPQRDDYWASPRMFYSHPSADPTQPWDWDSATPNDLLTGNVEYTPKTMTFTFGNMYPGTKAAGKYTMENNGTIPAVIQAVHVTKNTTDDIDDTHSVLGAIVVSGHLSLVRDNNVIADQYISGVSLDNLESTLNAFFVGKRLQPNDTIILGASDINPDATGELSPDTFNFEIPMNSLTGKLGEKETVEIGFQFDFVQHNDFAPAPAPAAQ